MMATTESVKISGAKSWLAAGNIGSQDDGSRRRGLYMRIRQPGMDRPHRHLHGKGCEESEPGPLLQAEREAVTQQRHDVGRARLPIHRHDGKQHQYRAEQRVKEELEARIDAAWT